MLFKRFAVFYFIYLRLFFILYSLFFILYSLFFILYSLFLFKTKIIIHSKSKCCTIIMGI
ncbi:hypothetical protein B0A65_20855 [Flavobacterium frigidimaris]|uniref:Uncharacterized protein n=1 Tax=Flavobacterium frigidimaris TaxID=262320 RepID=A0ABX4BKZ8_FLAFR|nr:hypothetical protein B0A65_20855 [Flavobacterium frigidimaris]